MIVLVVIGVLGILRISKGSEEELSFTGSMYHDIDIDNIPVGNNLMLRREVSPFTMIIRELGLM